MSKRLFNAGLGRWEGWALMELTDAKWLYIRLYHVFTDLHYMICLTNPSTIHGLTHHF